MHQVSEDSPRYTAMKQAIANFLMKQTEPVTTAEVVRHVGTYDFVWDALEALESSHLITNVGGVQISRWKYKHSKTKIKTNTKHCKACDQEKPLIEFYQEWSGSPSRYCRQCKIEKVTKRGRKSGKRLSTEEPEQ